MNHKRTTAPNPQRGPEPTPMPPAPPAPPMRRPVVRPTRPILKPAA
jgi:hypothetical protein